MTRRTTRNEAELDARLSQLDPSSVRYQILNAARQFRASWVDLGERLTKVREAGSYKAWGYASFEAYYRRELNLKNDTVVKLTRSFSFLRDHQPAVLRDEGPVDLPPLDVVDMLSQARQRSQVSDEQFEAITSDVFTAESRPTKQEVLKRFREIDPQAFKPAESKIKAVSSGASSQELRKALLLAERLESLLEAQAAESAISTEAVRGVRAAVLALRTAFERARAATEEADSVPEPLSA